MAGPEMVGGMMWSMVWCLVVPAVWHPRVVRVPAHLMEKRIGAPGFGTGGVLHASTARPADIGSCGVQSGARTAAPGFPAMAIAVKPQRRARPVAVITGLVHGRDRPARQWDDRSRRPFRGRRKGNRYATRKIPGNSHVSPGFSVKKRWRSGQEHGMARQAGKWHESNTGQVYFRQR
ncbi:hypothetical protein GDI2436 [Gluconacetobacter diazotrophicus PA1 5]|uniref:Uncharacterized protein n=1 Tax=Gluconacetobacter diazotrophicus (strain ATCC 49037 / DSM 5601 / CCUG 37298 / CIP 103539 / LMG 7603 / PAl5) TaxID=272568 RepID=A9HN14_GLUDA|nr:hypothetical protein GDI2436 [Gluconacetobacter diazotrophicus PA1 5]